MPNLTFADPVFAAYAIAASLMILKTLAMAGLTVVRMMQVRGGYRSPEDARRTALNPDPKPGQTEPNEAVERFRRIHQNDLENVPLFLAAGWLFMLTNPAPWLALVLYYGYVATRLLHFWAYASARTHDTRAVFWTAGVLILLAMVFRVLWVAVGLGSA